MRNVMNKAQSAALEMAMNYVLKDPERNLPKLVDIVEKLDLNGFSNREATGTVSSSACAGRWITTF